MKQLEHRLVRELGEIADQATTTPDALPRIRSRASSYLTDDDDEEVVIMLTPDPHRDRRRRPRVLVALAAVAAVVLILFGIVALRFGTDDIATLDPGAIVSEVATCPSGSRPDEPGPIDQARPSGAEEGDAVFSVGAVDAQSGRLVAVILSPGGGTWTMDVCTNSWTRASPAPVDLHNAQAVVYDADSDLVVAFAGPITVAYDVDSDTWAQSKTRTSPGATRSQAVYDPFSGLIVTRDEGGTMWTYDIDVDTWTEIDQGPTSPPRPREQVMVYDRAADRIVLYEDRGYASTWVFDPRGGGWSNEDRTIPEGYFSIDVGVAAYDEAAGLTILAHDGAMMAYDTAKREWRVLWEDGEDIGLTPPWSNVTGFAYDPVNERIIVIGVEVDDVWAFDSTTATWLELVPASR